MKLVNSKTIDLDRLFEKCKYMKLGAININRKVYNQIVRTGPMWFNPCTKLSEMKKYSYRGVLFIGWMQDDSWACEVYIELGD